MSKDSPKDLKVRTASAIVMIAVAGIALWAGGWVFTTFVAIVAAGLLWEWWGLISKFNRHRWSRALWMLGGVVYIGVGAWTLSVLRYMGDFWGLLAVFVAVFSSDTFAYLFGRFVGGWKLGTSISPNKTWSGVLGAIFGAALLVTLIAGFELQTSTTALPHWLALVVAAVAGAAASILAQLGDLFESWLKRRAGLKDSGTVIPGHGGLFDRLDGLVAVCFVIGIHPHLFWYFMNFMVPRLGGLG